MSQADLGTAFGRSLADVSNFPKLADRLQQGPAERALPRAGDDPSRGLGSHPAFRVGTASRPVIDTSRLYYDGNSQGGIMGGALTALAPDFTQAALGVAAMRYSLLLPRSVDFDQFAALLYPNYPDELVRPLILSLIQMLWDRGEPNGYANWMTTNPLPDTPPHRGADQRRPRRPPGDELRRRRGGAHDRRVGARAHPRPGTLARRRRARRGAADHELPVRGLGDLLLGHRPGAPDPGNPARRSGCRRRRSRTFPTAPGGSPRRPAAPPTRSS